MTLEEIEASVQGLSDTLTPTELMSYPKVVLAMTIQYLCMYDSERLEEVKEIMPVLYQQAKDEGLLEHGLAEQYSH
jgi:hypothetical protein